MPRLYTTGPVAGLGRPLGCLRLSVPGWIEDEVHQIPFGDLYSESLAKKFPLTSFLPKVLGAEWRYMLELCGQPAFSWLLRGQHRQSDAWAQRPRGLSLQGQMQRGLRRSGFFHTLRLLAGPPAKLNPLLTPNMRSRSS